MNMKKRTRRKMVIGEVTYEYLIWPTTIVIWKNDVKVSVVRFPQFPFRREHQRTQEREFNQRSGVVAVHPADIKQYIVSNEL